MRSASAVPCSRACSESTAPMRSSRAPSTSCSTTSPKCSTSWRRSSAAWTCGTRKPPPPTIASFTRVRLRGGALHQRRRHQPARGALLQQPLRPSPRRRWPSARSSRAGCRGTPRRPRSRCRRRSGRPTRRRRRSGRGRPSCRRRRRCRNRAPRPSGRASIVTVPCAPSITTTVSTCCASSEAASSSVFSPVSTSASERSRKSARVRADSRRQAAREGARVVVAARDVAARAVGQQVELLDVGGHARAAPAPRCRPRAHARPGRR